MDIKGAARFAVVVACALAIGCGGNEYNSKANADVRRLTTLEFKDLRPDQLYRERGVEYPKMRAIGFGQSAGGGAYVGATFAVGGGAAAILGAAVLVGAVAIEATRAETERRRTERLDVAVPEWDVQADLRRQMTAGLKSHGYELTAAPLLVVDKRVDGAKPFPIGRQTPLLKKEEVLAHVRAAPASDGVLNVQMLNYGIAKVERAFKTDRYIPYVVFEAKLYRRDNGKLIYNSTYLGLPTAPLPKAGEFDAAVADRKVVRQFYDEALANVSKLMIEDLRPQWAGK